MAKIYSRNGFWYGTADEMISSIEAKAARIEALEAQAAAADALARYASAQLAYMDLCDDKGDFERNLRTALAAYNEAKKGGA